MKNAASQTGDHEQGAIRAFVLADKQERFLGFLAHPKNRRKFTESLAHFRWFDQRFATPIQHKVDPNLKLWERHTQGIEEILRLLKSKGAGARSNPLRCCETAGRHDRDSREALCPIREGAAGAYPATHGEWRRFGENDWYVLGTVRGRAKTNAMKTKYFMADEPVSRILCGAPLCSSAPRRSFL